MWIDGVDTSTNLMLQYVKNASLGLRKSNGLSVWRDNHNYHAFGHRAYERLLMKFTKYYSPHHQLHPPLPAKSPDRQSASGTMIMQLEYVI